MASLCFIAGCSTLPQRDTLATEQPAVEFRLPEAAILEDASPEPANPEAEVVDNSIWPRIVAGFSLDKEINPRIQAQINWYVKHPRHMQRVCERARPFLFDIVEVLEKNNIPLEMALLPVIESAFQPFSYSSGRAAGLWQFIPGTGRLVGLQQNWWYDGRRDVHMANRGAAKYLLSVNKMLKKDWLHTLAGYNAGPGHVIKAKRRNKKRGLATDYWSLRLPKETMSYVPKLLAVAAIIENPEKYGHTLCDIPNQAALQLVTLNGQLDLSIAADLAQMSIEELYALNSGFNRWATPPKGPHHLLLPLDRIAAFQLAESALPKNQRVRWKRHKIASGDTLSQIAQRYHTTVKQIKAANQQIRGHNLRVGKHLLIPTSNKSKSAYSLSVGQRQAKILNAKGRGNKHIYTVTQGDSWWKIAKQYDVSHKSLARWNGKSPIDKLSVGQKLVIWSNKYASSPRLAGPMQGSKPRKLHYPVRRGDNLSTIAGRFRVAVKDIVKWNQLSKNKYLQPGQRLVLYVDVTKQSSDI